MDDVENGDSVVLEKIDDAVISKEDFTEVFTAEFRDDSADAWILEKRFCEFDDAIDERAVTHKRGVRKSEHLRVLSDDGYEICPSTGSGQSSPKGELWRRRAGSLTANGSAG